MGSIPIFLGLGYPPKSVQACVMDEAGRFLANRGRPNDTEAIESCSERPN